MNASSIASAPAALVPALVAAQLAGAGGGGDAADGASPGGDSVAISAQALAMLAAEQSAMAGMMSAPS